MSVDSDDGTDPVVVVVIVAAVVPPPPDLIPGGIDPDPFECAFVWVE